MREYIQIKREEVTPARDDNKNWEKDSQKSSKRESESKYSPPPESDGHFMTWG